MAHDEMFDSRTQRELLHGLQFWSELRGMALVTGQSGAGKSITTRRFARSLDDARFRVIYISQTPSTMVGFLRTINRALDLPMRQHSSDLFDQAHRHLTANDPGHGPHPMLVLDDAEGMPPDHFDVLRRLTNYEMDREDRFSVLVCGTDALLRTLKDPRLEPFNTRLSFVHTLAGFTLEDTRNYIRFQMKQAGARDGLFSDDATRRLFLASGGVPRRINQLGLQTLIQAAVQGIDMIDGEFLKRQVAAHPLYDGPGPS
jgi:type II secretory pathway predicted ATPase ExeA